MANVYPVVSVYELWVRVFVGEGQLGGVSLSATRFDRSVLLAAQRATRLPNGQYQQRLGLAAPFRGSTLSVVSDVVRANALSARVSVTATLYMMVPRDAAGQPVYKLKNPDKERRPVDFVASGEFGPTGAAHVQLELMLL